MKKESQLDENDHKLLRDSESWKFVCSGLPAEARESNDQDHLKWLERNTDCHAQQEIFMPLKGTSVYSLNGKSFVASPGTIFFFNSYEHHDRYYYQIKKDMKHLWFYIAGKNIVSRIHQASVKEMKYDVKQYIIREDFLFPALSKAWRNLKKTAFPVEIRRKALMSAFSLVLMEIAELDIQGSLMNKTSDHQAVIMTMIKGHIKETAGKDLTIENLAKLAGYSEFHFMRLFKKHFGQSVHSYINEVRIHKVNEMLKQGRMKKEISYELGFSCPAAFANWYRKNLKI